MELSKEAEEKLAVKIIKDWKSDAVIRASFSDFKQFMHAELALATGKAVIYGNRNF